MTAAIELRDLTVSYNRHPALHHINGIFQKGSLTAVIGTNGAGKSTLLKSIQGLVPVDAGLIHLHEPRAKVAYLPQQTEVDRNFPITVIDCVLMGDWRRSSFWRKITRSSRLRAQDALISVGLEGFAERALSSLSLGQFQRVLFARVLMQDASLILLDEPFSAVDERTTYDLMRLVQRWHDEGRTILAVLHDNELVRRFFPQTLLLARRVVAWGTTPEVLNQMSLLRTPVLHEAWNETAEVCEVKSVP